MNKENLVFWVAVAAVAAKCSDFIVMITCCDQYNATGN